ncbi:extracellular solute-binding protein [Luedemannella helvata]|uniref:Extracellular solute-binding protein n=1 Tax=Luedemannella helvata TaxID=349315 RepID=A0ABN2KI78_9ACTN
MRHRSGIYRTIASAAAGMALVLSSACGTSGPVRGGLQVWALQDPANEPIIKRGIEQFNAASGTRAALTTYANDAYKQKLQVSMGSPNAPDVFFNWGGGNLAQFVKANQVRDLTNALAVRPEVAKRFLPSVLDVGKINGHQYGIPMNGIQPVILFYNKRVFSEAGVQPPKTYDDLLALVELFKARGITPVALAGSQGWTELMWLEYLLDRVGGAEKFAAIAAGKAGAWRDPAVLQALTMCQDLAARGAFGKNFASVNYDNSGASKLFATGKAAMHLMGSWEYGSQAANNPKFLARGELGWVTFPEVTGGKGDPRAVVGNPSNYFSVRSDSPAADAATRFVVETLASDDYVADLIAAGQVPAVRGVEDKLAGTHNAEFTTFTYQLAVKAPTFTQSWDQALSPSAGAELNTNLQKLFLRDISPQGFVEAMEKAK